MGSIEIPRVGTAIWLAMRPLRSGKSPSTSLHANRHHYSRDRPENAPNWDIFGHNLNQLLTMQTLAVISILALIAIGGAAYTDQQLTSQQVTQKAD